MYLSSRDPIIFSVRVSSFFSYFYGIHIYVFLGSIIQKTKKDQIKNKISDTLSLEKLQDTLESNRIKWFGNIMRMSEHKDRLRGGKKRVTDLKINRKRSIERHRT